MQYDTGEISPHARTLYAAARQLADIVWEQYFPLGGDGWAVDRRWAEPGAPAWHRHTSVPQWTRDGLVLEMVVGVPMALTTPWGLWQFIETSSEVSVRDRAAQLGPFFDRLKERLTIEFHWWSCLAGVADDRDSPGVACETGHAIRAIDGRDLPKPEADDAAHGHGREAWVDGEAWMRKLAWRVLTEDWCEANGIQSPAKPMP